MPAPVPYARYRDLIEATIAACREAGWPPSIRLVQILTGLSTGKLWEFRRLLRAEGAWSDDGVRSGPPGSRATWLRIRLGWFLAQADPRAEDWDGPPAERWAIACGLRVRAARRRTAATAKINGVII